MAEERRKPTLYLTRNGLLEPLGQSQVFSYLRGLAAGYSITLITFEKPEDLDDSARMNAMKQKCVRWGINWWPQKFYRSPRFLAPALSMITLLLLCLRARRNGKADLIHARSYIPAAAAWVAFKITGTVFIFDMRALWPEELITAGRLSRRSLTHRIIRGIERVCLRDAVAVVSLTEAAVGYLISTYPQEMANQTIAVIPTCADLERFVPMVPEESGDRVYGCIGTVLSGWFKTDWLSAFIRVGLRRDPSARFEVVTRDDPEAVRKALGLGASIRNRVNIYAIPSDCVQDAVQLHTASAMFFTTGLSKLGSSPTRMGEILGCGRPVIANDGVGDVSQIIRKYNVGVLVRDGNDGAMTEALDQLEVLLSDPELPARCRRAAEEVFSLKQGTAAYHALYADIVGNGALASKSGGESPASKASNAK